MNETLKFSWGHIIAFLAIIAVSYVSFMGYTYLTNGNFTYALICMGITDTLYIIFFIGAQQMKASGKKLRKSIIWERIFLFGSPIIFIVGMISMSHFWTVRTRNDIIVQQFTSSIDNAKQIFTDYEEYVNKRISDYEAGLNTIITRRNSKPDIFRQAGFDHGKTDIQKDNMISVLRLQLLSPNYYNLKNAALNWIDNANKGASTWNVFLLGNTREIKASISMWENQLKSFSMKEMSNEQLSNNILHAPSSQGKVEDFIIPTFSSNGAQAALDGIEGLTADFTTFNAPNINAIAFGIVLYVMLLFPYLIQERHSKSSFGITGKKEKRNSGIKINSEDTKTTLHKGTFRL